MLTSVHLRKHWQRRVRVNFNQVAHKKIRAARRASKAAGSFPRPLQKLRPLVHATTKKYNAKVRYGRGFTH
jgi:large subunit ribosomal protein L13e